MHRLRATTLATVLAACLASTDASAFSHIVKPGEALAQIAERVYGDARLEPVLVGANALDAQGGSIIAPGMRLEVPAPGHHTVQQGETWGDLALSWLGSSDPARTELLARANKGVPWVPPVEGQEIEIPAVITYIAGDGETVNSIAARYWGDPKRGWELNPYNRRDGNMVMVKRGEVMLVPMPGLHLSEAGRAEARVSAERDGASGGMALEQQRKADSELPLLLSDVRYGRYAEAVARGNRLLGTSALTHPQLATVHRALLEAYVALDAAAAAANACAAWRSNEPNPVLDPVRVSPKIRAACDAR
jgi:LysM repeat protein